MKEKLQPLRILKGKNPTDCVASSGSSLEYRLKDNDMLPNYADAVLMTPGLYAKIFGKHRYESSKDDKLLSVVKLKYGNRAIYRRYIGVTCSGFTDGMCAITTSSWRLLGDNSECPNEKCVEVSPGSKFLYYWNHPSEATRITVRFSVAGSALAVALFFIGLLF